MSTDAFCRICVVAMIGSAFGYESYPHWAWMVLGLAAGVAGVGARICEEARKRAS